jgi:type I restriction enzyme S subunit
MRRGDVLFATVRPRLRRVAQVPPSLDGEVCSTAFTVLRARPELLDSSFLFYAVADPRFVSRVSRHERGSGYPAVSDGDVLREEIAVPPLPEQRAIALALHSVQRARETTDHVFLAGKTLKAAAMESLFRIGRAAIGQRSEVAITESAVGPLPSHWRVVSLGEIADTRSGGTPDRTKPEFFGGDVPWVKSGELRDGTLSAAEERLTKLGLAQSNAQVFPSGTLLVALYGATAGRVGMLGMEAATNQAVCAVFPDPEIAEAGFVFYWLMHRREQLLGRRHGGAQANLSQSSLRGFLLPVPPIDEQQAICAVLSTVDQKNMAEQQRRDALDVLFRALLSDLMTGGRRIRAAPESKRSGGHA